MNKNILITGGAGFIGSHLVRSLVERGDRVTVVDNFNEFYSPEKKRRNLEGLCDDIRLFVGDIRLEADLSKAFEGTAYDSIVHLAARAGVRPSLRTPRKYYETNVFGTLRLLEEAKKHGVGKFIFGSSSSVYGSRNKIPFSETDDVSKTISPYAATKAAGEILCHTYSHLYDIPTVCLRFFTVYGPSQRPDLAIHKFSRLISEGETIPIFGDGTSKRDYTHVDDIVSGVTAALDFDKSQFEIFNLGESETVELKYLIELLERNLGIEAIKDFRPAQPGDVPMTCADISKSKEMLGYDPKVDIETGVADFVDWFREENQ